MNGAGGQRDALDGRVVLGLVSPGPEYSVSGNNNGAHLPSGMAGLRGVGLGESEEAFVT